ncbi:uncharacterized protein BDR25DRAFT_314084 [Lindgomyces ingoldianus]|uniref:Uncharacterized protein n=1 Tax=Lindgomyces ingoldianus TaxID=673940 RepID=A0ACB6QXH9_9PLEO|nr:uncharacterized protein BDR25DRAFT_314084 [Lindgomyces ingoldianus]KAF2470901.1 hypothetical protein BDR25DRAFT_314084 [Lindgomyces ingoldianus]
MILQGNIHFEDVLERAMSLHYAHFRYFPVFPARLQCEFKGVPGERMVSRNKFHILDPKRSYRRITEGNWERSVLHGSSLAMSIVLERRHPNIENICPRCTTANTASTPQRLLRCCFCGLYYALGNIFTVGNHFPPPGNTIRPPILQVVDPDPAFLISNSGGGFTFQVPHRVDSDEEDNDLFRRVHVNHMNILESMGQISQYDH